jgi:hypothetical protein
LKTDRYILEFAETRRRGGGIATTLLHVLLDTTDKRGLSFYPLKRDHMARVGEPSHTAITRHDKD